MSSFLKLANKNTLKISNAFIVSSVKCSTQAAATNYLQYGMLCKHCGYVYTRNYYFCT